MSFWFKIASVRGCVAFLERLYSNGHISTGLDTARPPNLVGRL